MEKQFYWTFLYGKLESNIFDLLTKVEIMNIFKCLLHFHSLRIE